MIATLLIRGPHAQSIIDDLDELMARDEEQGAPRRRAMLRYTTNMLASACTVWRDRLRGPSLLEFKLGARMLIKHPGLTLVGGFALCLALTIVVAYAWIDANVLDPSLPFEEGDRVVVLQNWDTSSGGQELRLFHDFLTWREELESVDDVGAALLIRPNVITGDGQGIPEFAAQISASAFRVARVPPLLGRPLQEQDELAGAAPVAVLGYDLWQSRFGGDPDIVGRSIRLDGAEVEVVGVMPSGFRFPLWEQLWIPLSVRATEYPRRGGPSIRVFGRLAPGVSMEQAGAELSGIGQNLAAAFPETHAHLGPRVLPWAELVMPRGSSVFVTSTLLIVVVILLLVSANVGILVFARSAEREQEIAMRAALGASRRRIVLQLFVEAFLLASVAAGFALVLGSYAVGRGLDVMRLQWGSVPFWLNPDLPSRTIPYVAGFTILAALVASVPPALKLTGAGFGNSIRLAGARGSGLRFGRVATAVIVMQVAISVALLTRSANMLSELPGALGGHLGAGALPADEYLVATLEMAGRPLTGTADALSEEVFRDRYRASREALAQRLRAEPGVRGVTFMSELPMGERPERRIEIEGISLPSSAGSGYAVRTSAVAPDFFEVMSSPIVAGRGFDAPDGAALVVVVEDSFVERFLNGEDAVGRRIRFSDESGEASEWLEIVGVVQRIRLDSEDPAVPPGVYTFLDPFAHGLYMAAHLGENPEELTARLRAVSTSVDPMMRLSDVASLEQLAERFAEVGRSAALLVSFLALAALALCLAGIYALMSFIVSRRIHEIGIRTALGAGPRRIVATIFSRALMQLGLGLLVGVLISIALGGGWEASLESGSLVPVSSLMGLVGLLACALPTLRALRVQPTDAFREG
jgi:putative ABC transport system permease protein